MMCAQPSQGGPSRKRRRHAVVCTECRRRKIACDRSAPCTQCIQSGSACTYYNSYNSQSASSDFLGDQESGVKPHHLGSPPTAYAFAPGTQLAPSTRANDQHVFSMAPAATSIDTWAPNWFDTANLGGLQMPLSTALDATRMPFSGLGLDSAVDMEDSAAVEAALPMSPSPQEPADIIFQKSRLYGPSHWKTLLRKVGGAKTAQPRSELIGKSTSNKTCLATSSALFTKARAILLCRNARTWRKN